MLPVQRFTRAESIELLQTRLPALEAGEAGRLAAALEDLPLALDLAAATVTATGMSVDTYLRLLSSHRTDGATQPTPSVAACSVALDRLAVDDPPASALLTIAAWLGRQPVPLSLLTRHADQLPAPLAQTARSPAQLADLAATLRRRGLARVESNSVQLHRTPAHQVLARTVGDRPDQLTWAGWAVRLLRAAMPTQPHDPDGWPVWRQLLPHLLTATDPARHLDDVTLEVGWLLNHAASYLQARGEPRAARALFEDAYDLYRRRLGHDPSRHPRLLPTPSPRTCTPSASTNKPTASCTTPTSIKPDRPSPARTRWHTRRSCRTRVCQLNGVTDVGWVYLRPADRRPSKAMSKALRAGFQRIDQRRCPVPVGSRLMIAM